MANRGGICHREREQILRALREGREPVASRAPGTIEKFRSIVRRENEVRKVDRVVKENAS